MNIVTENLQLFFQQKRFTNRSSSEIYEPVFHDILEHPEIPQQQIEDQLVISDLTIDGRFMSRGHPLQRRTGASISFVSWNLLLRSRS